MICSFPILHSPFSNSPSGGKNELPTSCTPSMWAYCGDYSRPMLRHFRAWLRQTYAGDVLALRAAWADSAVTFETTVVPPAEAQLTTTRQPFRDPRYEQNIIDYYRCLADLCGDLIIDFNRTVRKASGAGRVSGQPDALAQAEVAARGRIGLLEFGGCPAKNHLAALTTRATSAGC